MTKYTFIRYISIYRSQNTSHNLMSLSNVVMTIFVLYSCIFMDIPIDHAGCINHLYQQYLYFYSIFYCRIYGRFSWLTHCDQVTHYGDGSVLCKTLYFHYKRIPSNLRFCDFAKVDIIIFYNLSHKLRIFTFWLFPGGHYEEKVWEITFSKVVGRKWQ